MKRRAVLRKDKIGPAAGFACKALLVFFLAVGPSIKAGHSFFTAQNASGSGSIRPDGKLDFLGPDGNPVASIDIEIAKTAEERRKGLMGRTSLRPTEGMLFIFEGSAVRYFWMYDTPLSLDMIFVDPEKRIVHIAESTRPMSTETYSSRLPSQYVVEVPGGFARFFKVEKGMRIQWRSR